MKTLKRVSLDTNVVLRIILGDIPEQRDLAMALVAGAVGQCQVSDIVFVELEYAMRQHYKISRDNVAILLGSFGGHPKINCSRVWLDKVLEAYRRYPALSFTDIALAEYASIDGGQLYTFDKKLAHQLTAAVSLG